MIRVKCDLAGLRLAPGARQPGRRWRGLLREPRMSGWVSPRGLACAALDSDQSASWPRRISEPQPRKLALVGGWRSRCIGGRRGGPGRQRLRHAARPGNSGRCFAASSKAHSLTGGAKGKARGVASPVPALPLENERNLLKRLALIHKFRTSRADATPVMRKITTM